MPKRRLSASSPAPEQKDEQNSCDGSDEDETTKTKASKSLSASKSTGLDEIDDLFAKKKQQKKEAKKQEEQQERQQKRRQYSTTLSKNKRAKLSYSREDTDGIDTNEWVDDGLGGKFNKDGFTGRTEGGVRIFKAHLFNSKQFANTPDCPFDCDCCYI